MLGENRLVHFGRRDGVTEREAVGIFREFTVEELTAVISPQFSNREELVVARDMESSSAHSSLFDHLKSKNPSAYFFGRIIDRRFPIYRLKVEFAERFARILDVEGDKVDSAVEHMGELVFIQRALLIGLAGAFTSQAEREAVFTEAELITPRITLHLYQGEQIVRGVADLSAITEPLAVVAAVGNGFLVDHEAALRHSAEKAGTSITSVAELEKGDPLFKRIYADAGKTMLEGTLYGALLDHAHGGEGSVFRPEPNPHGLPQTPTRYKPRVTARGLCTGSPFVLAAVQAVGRAISNNSAVISDVIAARV